MITHTNFVTVKYKSGEGKTSTAKEMQLISTSKNMVVFKGDNYLLMGALSDIVCVICTTWDNVNKKEGTKKLMLNEFLRLKEYNETRNS